MPNDRTLPVLIASSGECHNRKFAAFIQREIFERHLAPWIGRFFADLERAESAEFYARVGAVGRTFVDIDPKAFTLPASGQVL